MRIRTAEQLADIICRDEPIYRWCNYCKWNGNCDRMEIMCKEQIAITIKEVFEQYVEGKQHLKKQQNF